MTPPQRTFLVFLGSAALLSTGAWFFSDLQPKRRIRRQYHDPYARKTRRLTTPRESMREIVYGR